MSDFLNLQTGCNRIIRNNQGPEWSSGSFLSHIKIPIGDSGKWMDIDDSNASAFAEQTLVNFKNSFVRIYREIDSIDNENLAYDKRTLALPQVLYDNGQEIGAEKREDLKKIINQMFDNSTSNLHNKCIRFIQKNGSDNDLLNEGIGIIKELVKAGEKGVGEFSNKITPGLQNIARKNIEKMSASIQCESFYRSVFGLSIISNKNDGQLIWRYEEKPETLIFKILPEPGQQQEIRTLLNDLGKVICYACHTQLYSMAYLKNLKKEHPGNFNAKHYAYWNAMDCEHKLAFLISQLFYTLQLNKGAGYRAGTFDFREQHSNSQILHQSHHILESFLEYAGCCKKCNIRKSSINCNKKSEWDRVKTMIKDANPAFVSGTKLNKMNLALNRVYNSEFKMLNDEIQINYPVLYKLMSTDDIPTPPSSTQEKAQTLRNIYKIISKSYLIYTDKVITDLVKAHVIGNHEDHGTKIATLQEGINKEWNDILIAIENHSNNLKKNELETLINHYKNYSMHIIHQSMRHRPRTGWFKDLPTPNNSFVNTSEDALPVKWKDYVKVTVFPRIQNLEKYVRENYGIITNQELWLDQTQQSLTLWPKGILNNNCFKYIESWEEQNTEWINNVDVGVPNSPPKFINTTVNEISSKTIIAAQNFNDYTIKINKAKLADEAKKKTFSNSMKKSFKYIKEKIKKNMRKNIKTGIIPFLGQLCSGLGVQQDSLGGGGKAKKKQRVLRIAPFEKKEGKRKRKQDNTIVIDDIFGIGTYRDYELMEFLRTKQIAIPGGWTIENLTEFLNTNPGAGVLANLLVENNIYRKQIYPYPINNNNNYEYLPIQSISGVFKKKVGATNIANFLETSDFFTDSNSNNYNQEFLRDFLKRLNEDINKAWSKINESMHGIEIMNQDGGLINLPEFLMMVEPNHQVWQPQLPPQSYAQQLPPQHRSGLDATFENVEQHFSFQQDPVSLGGYNAGGSKSKAKSELKRKNSKYDSNVLKKYKYDLLNFISMLATYYTTEKDIEEEDIKEEDMKEEDAGENFCIIVKELLEKIPSIPEIYSKTLDIGLKYYIDGKELQRISPLTPIEAIKPSQVALSVEEVKLPEFDDRKMVKNPLIEDGAEKPFEEKMVEKIPKNNELENNNLSMLLKINSTNTKNVEQVNQIYIESQKNPHKEIQNDYRPIYRQTGESGQSGSKLLSNQGVKDPFSKQNYAWINHIVKNNSNKIHGGLKKTKKNRIRKKKTRRKRKKKKKKTKQKEKRLKYTRYKSKRSKTYRHKNKRKKKRYNKSV